MTPEEFEQLIGQREGEKLELKQEMPSSSDLAKLITAFYNTRGGTIVFGIEDGTGRLMGVSSPQGSEEGVVNILGARCSLDVMPTIGFVPYHGMEFVAVKCPQGARKPYLVSGETRPYIRLGSSNREAYLSRGARERRSGGDRESRGVGSLQVGVQSGDACF